MDLTRQRSSNPTITEMHEHLAKVFIRCSCVLFRYDINYLHGLFCKKPFKVFMHVFSCDINYLHSSMNTMNTFIPKRLLGKSIFLYREVYTTSVHGVHAFLTYPMISITYENQGVHGVHGFLVNVYQKETLYEF